MSDSGNTLVGMTNTQEPQNTNTSGVAGTVQTVAGAATGLKLYDTASHTVSSFVPLKPGQVGIYVCGATVQSSPHIGHIRAAVAFDVVRRWFQRLGYKVTFVRNVTDIDDKILDKAAAAGQQWWERAYIYEREFTEAYDALGVEPPTYEPRATGHMIDMIDLIRKIIDNGHGYVVTDENGNPTGNVYFDVASWPHYGELTHQKQTAVSDDASKITDAMGPSVDNAGDDKYNPIDPADMSPDKHDPRDFALWKAPKDSDPLDARWNTPFGTGRPGWHIECSAMSHRYLKDMFDIHGGGLDLRFPHHENEMAQTRAAGYDSAARWMHSAWVTAKGEKMSKSLGNTIYLSDSEEELRTKVMSMYTDPNHIRIEDPGQVEGNTVFTYLDALVQPDSFEKYLPEYKNLDELKSHYRRGGLGDVKVKKFLLKVLNEFLVPIRERRAYYEEHPEVVVDVLRKGTEKANAEAEQTLDKMKKAMQIDYFNQWAEDYNLDKVDM